MMPSGDWLLVNSVVVSWAQYPRGPDPKDPGAGVGSCKSQRLQPKCAEQRRRME